MDADESQLVEQAQAGDMLAFEALLNLHASFVYNLALRTLNDSREAEDIAQEAFVRAWQALPNFRAESRFRTWLYRIVINLCYNRLPGLRNEMHLLTAGEVVELENDQRPVERGLINRELGLRMQKAIDNLPEHYRLLITLRHLQKMSYTEIAEACDLPLGTVKTGIFRARRILRSVIEESWNSADD